MNNIESKYRYELKYVLRPQDYSKIISILYTHPAGFTKQYENRWVNNIYFDNPDLSSAFQNLNGISNRKKIRYRWYGELSQYMEGVLEQKLRKNKLGNKEYIPLSNITSLVNLTKKVQDSLNQSNIGPTLQNRYLREYYIDFSNQIRLTIDSQLYYMPLNDSVNENTSQFDRDFRIVVELKFDKKEHHLFGKISKFLPFKLNKHSKYISGLEAIRS